MRIDGFYPQSRPLTESDTQNGDIIVNTPRPPPKPLIIAKKVKVYAQTPSQPGTVSSCSRRI